MRDTRVGKGIAPGGEYRAMAARAIPSARSKACAPAAVLLVLSAASAQAQIVPPGVAPPAPVVPPSAPGTPAPTVVEADQFRVFGDDAPVFSPLALVGALGLNVSASLQTEYIDNVARLSEGEPLGSRYKSKDDWAFRPSVSLSAARPFGRQQLFLNGVIGRDFYARNTTLDRNRIGIDGGINWVLGTRCGGRVQGGYSKRGTQFGTFEEVIPSTQERTIFLASGSCRTVTGLSANINYNTGKTRNKTDDPTGQVDRSFANVNQQGVNGGIGYPLGRRGEIGIQGNWNEQEFPNQPLANGDLNGTEIYGANVFGNYRVGTTLRATGGIGKSWVKPKAPLADDFAGLTWNLGLNYTGPRIGAALSMGRSVNGSSGGSSNYSLGTFYNASVNYKANNRLSMAAGMAFSNTDYRGINQLPETEDIDSAKMRRYFIGADYRLNRILAFALDFNHQNRSSQPSSQSYKVNSIGLTARAAF